MATKQKIFLSLLVVLFVFGVGIVIPKFTVNDLVAVSPKFKKNITAAIYENYDNPLQRIALFFGKSRVVVVNVFCFEVQSFTIFRIPLGVLRGASNERMSVCFNVAGDDYSSGVINK